MSHWKEPVGKEAKSVYFRRRLLVLGGLIALIAFVALVIFKPGASGGAASAPEVQVPKEIVAADKKQDKTVKAGEVRACPAGELVVTPITDLDNYAPGEEPKLSLRVENKGDSECEAQLGTSNMNFRVSSGSDEVWRSTDCQINADNRAVLLEPGKPLETEPITWDRTRSSKDTCEISRDPVTAEGATYHLQVSAAGVPGTGTAAFLLY